MGQISIWMVELGHLDIYINVALLSSFLAQPCSGHLEAIPSIYGYLKYHDESTMVFDDAKISLWGDSDFPHFDRVDFYKDAKEAIPPNAPKPHGASMQINVFMEANHARNCLNRRSHTGILIYLNTAPIV